jgi:FlaA1/EpsC-like NDP-sugar epimerase
MGSNGSVIPFFLNRRASGVLPITEPTMTRFNISLADGVKMVLHAMEHSWGGELYVPKIPSYRITDVAEAIGPECEHPVIGIRPGEKIHEEMITSSDSFTTYDLGEYYVILPQVTKWDLDSYIKKFDARKVPSCFSYTSEENEDFETVKGLRALITEHVDANFNA